MNAPSTSTTNSARHRCFMLSPNTDERGSLDSSSYKGGHVFSRRELTDELDNCQAKRQVFP